MDLLGLKFYSINVKLLSPNLLNTLILISFTSINVGYSQNVLCPEILANVDDLCSRVTCLSSVLDERNCPEGTYHQANITMCNCCPGCAIYISSDPAKNELCTKNDQTGPNYDPLCNDKFICPVIMNSCEPGFECKEDNSVSPPKTVCKQPDHEEICGEFGATYPCMVHSPPSDPKIECPYKKFLFKHGKYHWDPVCDDTGYAPKQCKGTPGTYDGECFCVDVKGRRIFGRQWWAVAENQTCACSRMISQLRSTDGGSNIATLHCTPEGNYEPVQCDTDSGTCWCVDPGTGKTTGAILPQNQWKLLPCYSVNLTNPEMTDNYLRVCDSEMAGRVAIKKDAAIHGIEIITKEVYCDYDGSFAPLQNDGTTMTCTHKNGDRIQDFFKSGNNEDMDCKCARDEVHYAAEKRPFPFAGKCAAQIGNYLPVYDFGGISSCIDRDGFAYGKSVSSEYVCCLLDECYAEINDNICKKEGYLPCKQASYNL